ncbi:DUF2264 domain-containing protein [Isoptericola sp. S6320L]|uniref:DUF2264 domain-containing protein n=1 Tax=Isoptericola sp. S6320L TaxID=2926411 RepID=UPI001FF49845|nr:DUF2264 domain-containing protein [Isoptericola sp. S6320L]MCK0118217.1 DUF2264 domain-containing protein [Isoptericola sp. S6320L]
MTDATTAVVTAALEPTRRWERQHWLATADRLLAAVEPYASSGRSLIRLPGPTSASGAWSDGLEGFARTFLLAAFRVRGEQGADPHGLLERYAEGLRHGTDPAGAERWPRIDERRQAVVEAASVAIGLSETRPWLWDRLDDATRGHVVDWLAGIVGTSGYRNNWVWFQNVVEAFLASVGGPWDQADLDRNEELAEGLYVGDGWYSDGRGRDGRRQSFDYYAGWAWHLYPLLHARIEGRPLDQRHAERLHAYLGQAQHLVGPTGAPVLQGRSITYRFAMLAPFWAGALAGSTPLPPGATRAITSAVAEHFVAAGSVDERGLLPTGWHHRYDGVRQLYSGGSSPYWASKGFLGLLLDADDPVWTAAPELPPSWAEDRVTALPVPGWLVSATPGDGIVRVLNHGSDRLLEPVVQQRADDPFYRRLGYSNVTSPQLTTDAVAAPVESHVALLDGSGAPSHRDGIDRVRLSEDVAVSRSRVHWLDLPGGRPSDAAVWSSMRRGPFVTTAAVVRGRFEVRLAWWDPVRADVGLPPATPVPAATLDAEAAWPADPGPWQLHVGGWPLAAGRDRDLHVETDVDWVRVTRQDGTSSLVRGLRGLDRAGTTSRTGADPYGEASVTPWVRSRSTVGPGDVSAALVVLSGRGTPWVRDVDAVTEVRHDEGEVHVVWRDGRVDTLSVTEGDDA